MGRFIGRGSEHRSHAGTIYSLFGPCTYGSTNLNDYRYLHKRLQYWEYLVF